MEHRLANELCSVRHLDINVRELIRLANHHPRVNVSSLAAALAACIAVDRFIAAAAPPAPLSNAPRQRRQTTGTDQVRAAAPWKISLVVRPASAASAWPLSRMWMICASRFASTTELLVAGLDVLAAGQPVRSLRTIKLYALEQVLAEADLLVFLVAHSLSKGLSWWRQDLISAVSPSWSGQNNSRELLVSRRLIRTLEYRPTQAQRRLRTIRQRLDRRLDPRIALLVVVRQLPMAACPAEPGFPVCKYLLSPPTRFFEFLQQKQQLRGRSVGPLACLWQFHLHYFTGLGTGRTCLDHGTGRLVALLEPLLINGLRPIHPALAMVGIVTPFPYAPRNWIWLFRSCSRLATHGESVALQQLPGYRLIEHCHVAAITGET